MSRDAHDALRMKVRLREDAGSEALDALQDRSADVGAHLYADYQERAMWLALDTNDPSHRELLVLFYRKGQSAR